MGGWLRHHVVDAMPGHIIGWVIGGAIVALSGVSPDDWIAHLVHSTSEFLPSDWSASMSALIARSSFAGVGVAVLAVTLFLGRRPEERPTPLAKATSSTPAQPAAVSVLSLPAKLSIAVLPLQNLSGAVEQEYFVDGVTESLITDISRIAGSFVIASNTAFTYKGRPVDVRQIGRDLNVRYVLEGSVQRGDSGIRVNVQLVETESGAQIWGERFDTALGNLFHIQDEIVARLANTLRAELIDAEARRTAGLMDLDCLDLYFRGMAWIHKGVGVENVAKAQGFFERALSIDGNNVDAMVGMAYAQIARSAFLSEERLPPLAAAEAILTKALSLAPKHAWAHSLMGAVYFNTKRAAEAVPQCEQALQLDRNCALAHAYLGASKFMMGRGEETERHIRDALLLSPRDPYANIWMMFAGLGKFQTGADEEGARWLRRSVSTNPNSPIALFNLAGVLGQLGDLSEARKAVVAGLALNPGFTVSRYRAGASSDNAVYLNGRARIVEGMLKAGVPE